MRIRRKPWARPELEAASFFVKLPEENRGKWGRCFESKKPLILELGCGKGVFISKLASQDQGNNYVGIDIKDEMLVLAKRSIENEYESKSLPINNVLLTAYDISRISKIFSSEDIIDRIYINFCNPWPKSKHKKRRLTHPRQLAQYRNFLKDSGKIFFKTDDDDLFNDSVNYFLDCNFNIISRVDNLSEENLENNIVTEHEEMFKREGKSIKFLVAQKLEK